MNMYKPITCLIVLLVLAAGCAKKPTPSTTWGSRATGAIEKDDVKRALKKRSLEVKAIKGRFWAKVKVGKEKERPSLRTEVYWMKGASGGPRFRVFGLGPFSMTIFEARLSKDYFYLLIPRHKVLYKDEVSLSVRDLFRLVFDPWGVALTKGAQVRVDDAGNIVVTVRGKRTLMRALFKADLTPLLLEMCGVEVKYRLPREILLSLSYHGVPISVTLSISAINLVEPSEILSILESPMVVAGFRVESLRSLLDEHP